MSELSVNGKAYSVEDEPTALLLDVLRNRLGLTAARFGCGAGECGACSVLVDGRDTHACMTEIGHLVGKSIVTLEGIVLDDWDLRRAVRISGKADGVKRVIDDLDLHRMGDD